MTCTCAADLFDGPAEPNVPTEWIPNRVIKPATLQRLLKDAGRVDTADWACGVPQLPYDVHALAKLVWDEWARLKAHPALRDRYPWHKAKLNVRKFTSKQPNRYGYASIKSDITNPVWRLPGESATEHAARAKRGWKSVTIKINVSPFMSPASARQIVLHEMVHVVAPIYGPDPRNLYTHGGQRKPVQWHGEPFTTMLAKMAAEVYNVETPKLPADRIYEQDDRMREALFAQGDSDMRTSCMITSPQRDAAHAQAIKSSPWIADRDDNGDIVLTLDFNAANALRTALVSAQNAGAGLQPRYENAVLRVLALLDATEPSTQAPWAGVISFTVERATAEDLYAVLVDCVSSRRAYYSARYKPQPDVDRGLRALSAVTLGLWHAAKSGNPHKFSTRGGRYTYGRSRSFGWQGGTYAKIPS